MRFYHLLSRNATSCGTNNSASSSSAASSLLDENCEGKDRVQGQGQSQGQLEIPERTLARKLSKDDFLKMRIIGQFNLGFIVAELRGDLFILDQHACDEKYRFEQLQHSTIIHQQPLIVPLNIEATASEEIVIMENMQIFEANGFKLEISHDEHPGKRVKLLTVPFSKGVQFGVDDVKELASMIGDEFGETAFVANKLILKNDAVAQSSSQSVISPESQSSVNSSNSVAGKQKHNPLNRFAANVFQGPRLPKLLQMFASRACRSAIMIGDHMTVPEMKLVVKKLHGIEQPWNCPHGRPTLRHLVDFTLITDKFSASTSVPSNI